MINEIREKAILTAVSTYDDRAPHNLPCVISAMRAAIDAYEKALWRPIEEAGNGPCLVANDDNELRVCWRMTAMEDGEIDWVYARRLSAISPIAFVLPDPTHFMPLPALPEMG